MILWDLYFAEYTLRNTDGAPDLINKDTESQKEERICSGPKGVVGILEEEMVGGCLLSQYPVD